MKKLICLIRWQLDKLKLKNKCVASVYVTKKNEKRHGYFLITFGRKLVQLFDTEYLYSMSLKEFYENYHIIRY